MRPLHRDVLTILELTTHLFEACSRRRLSDVNRGMVALVRRIWQVLPHDPALGHKLPLAVADVCRGLSGSIAFISLQAPLQSIPDAISALPRPHWCVRLIHMGTMHSRSRPAEASQRPPRCPATAASTSTALPSEPVVGLQQLRCCKRCDQMPAVQRGAVWASMQRLIRALRTVHRDCKRSANAAPFSACRPHRAPLRRRQPLQNVIPAFIAT